MKILYLTHLSWSDINSLPSNFSYYIKELQKVTDVEIELLNIGTIKGRNPYIIKSKIIRKINKTKADILYLNNTMGLNFLLIAKKSSYYVLILYAGNILHAMKETIL